MVVSRDTKRTESAPISSAISLSFLLNASSSCCVGKSIPQKQGCCIGGDANLQCTFVAPASRNICVSTLDVVPRTKESSTTTIFLSLTADGSTVNFALTFASLSKFSMNVRESSFLFNAYDNLIPSTALTYPSDALRPDLGTGTTKSKSSSVLKSSYASSAPHLALNSPTLIPNTLASCL